MVTIELFGHPYTFRAESESIRAKEVADFLLQEVHKVQDQYPDRSSSSKMAIVILAALNIANENIELRKKHGAILDSISTKSEALLSKLDES
jgi:cell division protein ZapA (FtsZ GTPase activity inhibitor)